MYLCGLSLYKHTVKYAGYKMPVYGTNVYTYSLNSLIFLKIYSGCEDTHLFLFFICTRVKIRGTAYIVYTTNTHCSDLKPWYMEVIPWLDCGILYS